MDDQTIERVKKGIKDCSVGPETIALMLTRACNLRCLYCRGGRVPCAHEGKTGLADELSSQELLEMFLDARELGVREINLGGMSGEPFCKENILWILAKIKELGFTGSMTTNGSFLNRSVADFMTECNWDILLLSFDSSDRDIQHALRPAANGEAYFERIIEFLQRLDDLNSKVRVLLNVVISKLNYRKFQDLVEFANSHKCIESINVLKLLNTGFSKYDSLQLDAGDLEEFRRTLLSLENEVKIKYIDNWVERDDPVTAPARTEGEVPGNISMHGCFTNYYILSIDSNGDIIKCPQHLVNVAGLNIKNSPLKQLWKKEHLSFREGLAKRADCFSGCCTILKEQNKLIGRHLPAVC